MIAPHPAVIDLSPGLRSLFRVGDAATPNARAFRVGVLLGATVLMALGDLYMTLTFARSVGMLELNPIGRALMGCESPLAVVLFKLATTMFGASVIYWARRRRGAEVAAWLVCGALAALTIHWILYSRGMAELTPEVASMAMVGDPRWVQMTP